MKKRAIALLTVLLLGLTACGQTGANLMENASPSTSAIALYVWDGETVQVQYLFDTQQEQTLLDDLNALSAEPLDSYSIDELSAPVYAIEISDQEGYDLTGTWCGGIWVTRDGTAYDVDADFPQLTEGYDWSEADTRSLTAIPGIHYLATDGKTWNTALLSPAAQQTQQDGISFTATDVLGTQITVQFRNESGQEWDYGLYYGLEVQVDGQWYQVPAAQSYGVNDIAMILSDGQTSEERYDLSVFGSLPDGDYRLTVDGGAMALSRVGGQWQAA